MRRGRSAQTALLLYADVCMSLGEGSTVAKDWAKSAYQEVRLGFKNTKEEKDTCFPLAVE